jgi:hypothetical protein
VNTAAERHLAKAEGYLAKGDSWYHKAADEIVAAMEADTTLGQQKIADRLGKSRAWVRDIVAWHTSGRPAAISWHRGSHATTAEIQQGARRLLREAPLEQVEQIISELPAERQQAIGAAAGHRYLRARQDHDEAEARLTPAQRREREAGRAETQRLASKMTAGFATLGIIGHLEQVVEEMRELNADSSITPQQVEQIEAVLKDILTEVEVARAMAGMEGSEIG